MKRILRTVPAHRKLRNAVVLTTAAASIFRGIAYLPATTDGRAVQLTYVDWWLPVNVWALVWIAVGAWLCVSLVFDRLTIAGMSAFVGLTSIWAVSYIASWAVLESPRSWLTGTTLAALAVFAAILTSLIERRVPTLEDGK